MYVPNKSLNDALRKTFFISLMQKMTHCYVSNTMARLVSGNMSRKGVSSNYNFQIHSIVWLRRIRDFLSLFVMCLDTCTVEADRKDQV